MPCVIKGIDVVNSRLKRLTRRIISISVSTDCSVNFEPLQLKLTFRLMRPIYRGTTLAGVDRLNE